VEGEIKTPKLKGPEALKVDDPKIFILVLTRFVIVIVVVIFIVESWMSSFSIHALPHLAFPATDPEPEPDPDPESFQAMWLKSNASEEMLAGLVEI
jgi:hypothetical protein